MGYIATTAFRLGKGSVPSPIQVEEPPGFTGDMVTPTGQGSRKDKLQLKRKGRTVHATYGEAVAALRNDTGSKAGK